MASSDATMTQQNEDYKEEDEEYNEEAQEGDDDDYEYDDEFDAKAEEMAHRLQEQLRADIARAQLEVAAATSRTALPSSILQGPATSTHINQKGTESSWKKKQVAVICTMKAILSLASKDPLVHSTLSASLVPIANNASIFDVLNKCVSSGTISKKVAKPLSETVVSLAKSEVLFASLRNSSAPARQLNKGKRKRDSLDNGLENVADPRFHKRMAIDQPDLKYQINEAVRIVTQALTSASSTSIDKPLDPSLTVSIQVQLHQIFLFAVTSSPRAGERAAALQELGGLIQMLGVLSGIHISSSPSPSSQSHAAHLSTWNPSFGYPSAPPDLGTAVYPCLVPTCSKIFHRLYSLRAHQRLHSLVDRPFRCSLCPASFVRNHDLKRHARLHDKKAWRCSGCGKVFSRRDAIKRHKDSRGRTGGKGRNGDSDMGDSVCAYAEVEEVEVEKPHGDEEASRRAKLWNEIAANHMAVATVSVSGLTNASPAGAYGEDAYMEEGEVEAGVIEEGQVTVLRLHGLLQTYVSKGLGSHSAPPVHPYSFDVGHATLASVIARTQQQMQSPCRATAPNLSLAIPVAPSSGQPVQGSHESSTRSTGMALPSSSLSTALSLSEEQTKLLEQAIARAASAAQAQAEAEAALEEGEDYDDEDNESGYND
ncbi:hypothetical protein AcW1_001944 [Taiwanofungus camphoratus]|nr:hypothetical protein AcW1_001944 [Antrodia cinnamomea]